MRSMRSVRLATPLLQRRGMATLLRSSLVGRAVQFPVKNALKCAPHVGIPGAEDVAAWTLAQLSEQSGAVGNGLLQLVGEGDTVALAVGNCSERVAVQQGAAAAGLRLADAGTGLTKDGLRKLLAEQGVKALIVAPSEMAAVYDAIPELAAIPRDSSTRLSLAEFPELKFICQTGLKPQNGTHRLKDVLVYNSVTNDIEALSGEDRPFLAVVDPATGAVQQELSQKAVLEQSAAKAKECKIDKDLNVLFNAKKDFASNLCVATLACALSNAQLVVAAETYDEAALAASKDKHNCTASYA